MFISNGFNVVADQSIGASIILVRFCVFAVTLLRLHWK